MALALGLGVALGAGRHGLPDSATYLNAAEHLAHGDGYVVSALDARGGFAAVSCFAPLFSSLIALRMRLGQGDALEAMSDVVALSFALYALACQALFRILLPGRLRQAAGAFAFAMLLWPGSLLCLRAALSDLLGAALALCFCVSLLQGRSSYATWRSAVWLAFALWARWANLYVAAGACLGVLLAEREVALAIRLRRVSALLAGAVFALGPLWLRNLALTGTLMGPRARVLSDPIEHARRALEGLGSPLSEAYLALSETPLWPLCVALFALLVLAAAAAVTALVCWRDARTNLGWCIVFASAGLLVLSSSRTEYDALTHPRFWLALVPLIWALVLRALARLVVRGDGVRTLLPRAAFALCASALLFVTARSALALQTRGFNAPPRSGVLVARYADSSALRIALLLADAGRCHLAAPHAFWLYPQIGMRPIRWLEDGEVPRREVAPLCVLVLRDREIYDADVTPQRQRLQQAARAARAQWLQQDELAELWLQWPEPRPVVVALEPHAVATPR